MITDTLLPELLKGVSVFALAFVAFWPAIVTGVALGLHPGMVVALTVLSYSCGVLLIAVFGGRVRAWLMKRLGKGDAALSSGRMRAIWDRYGVIGLGLAAPMTVGAQLGAAVGMALNAQPRRLVVSMALGALLWSIALTAAVSLGLLGAQAAFG